MTNVVLLSVQMLLVTNRQPIAVTYPICPTCGGPEVYLDAAWQRDSAEFRKEMLKADPKYHEEHWHSPTYAYKTNIATNYQVLVVIDGKRHGITIP